jgi:MFS family permease
MMTLGVLIFALAGYSKNELLFFTVSLFARILQGVADAIISVTIPSIIAIGWPNNQEQYLGYNTMSNGIGGSLGPLIGALVYE